MKKYLLFLLLFGCNKEAPEMVAPQTICKTCSTSGYTILPSGITINYTLPQSTKYCNGEWMNHEGAWDSISITNKDTTRYHSFTSCN